MAPSSLVSTHARVSEPHTPQPASNSVMDSWRSANTTPTSTRPLIASLRSGGSTTSSSITATVTFCSAARRASKHSGRGR